METICNPCPDFTCVCQVPECTETLNLGTIADVNTIVLIYVQKNVNGKSYVQGTVSSATGEISLDMTDPNSSFFNHFDGSYYVWATKAGYHCEGGKLEITQAGTVTTTYLITFSKSSGSVIGTTVEIQPV